MPTALSEHHPLIFRSVTMYTLEVLNPVAQQRGVLTTRPINPRPASLDRKTVGLLWSGTHGGDVALKRVGELLQDMFTDVTVNFYTGGNYPAPPPIVRQAAEACDVVVGATAD